MFRFKNEPHHFHNGGIWFIWLGWFAIGLKTQKHEKELNELYNLMHQYLEEHKQLFNFNEYISSDDMKLNGTVSLGFTATGLLFAELAKSGFDFREYFNMNEAQIKEPIEIKKETLGMADSIISKMNLTKDKTVICIAGESGCGKTTTAISLRKRLIEAGHSVFIIHQDSYYHLPPQENHIKRKSDFSWVGVQEVDTEKIQHHIHLFKQNATEVNIPIVDYAENRFTNEIVDLSKYDILIVEGVYAMYLDDFDYKIFFENTYKETKKTRMERTREEYDEFVEKVLEKEHQLVQAKSNEADITIDKNFKVK